MRLLEILPNGDFHLTEKFIDRPIPRYAILSHTWRTEEVTFEDMIEGTGAKKAEYNKIKFCGEQAARDGLQYFWVDSCCIKKSSDAELSESLNSMFRWYYQAEKCYVYLSDVSTRKRKRGNEQYPWEQAFRGSRWFTRGWTLQELLAPSSVEFFSQEGIRLGDKKSLELQIQAITEIPTPALQRLALSHFSTDQKFDWVKNRQTTREEDIAYSLLGIFEVSMPVVYGEGRTNAVRRLRKEINDLSKDKECLRQLYVTNPRDDKARIEETRGGLIQDSYRWILENCEFTQWCNDKQSHLLWIKGDPGKGKTMLLCGIIDELKKSTADTYHLSYFFCQATDSRINNATAVLRGLLYLIIDQQPSLISHIRKQHDPAGKSLFEDANAWIALSEIFTNILQDRSLESTYLIVDALDECITDLPKLLDFIIQKSSVSPRVKWLVSSRDWPPITEQLERAGSKVKLCLELNAKSVSTAVSIYIEHKVDKLAQEKEYDDKTRNVVRDYLSSKANNTFLWVALVCGNLQKIKPWNVLARLNEFPPGLSDFYGRMIELVDNSDDADLCKRILAVIAVIYRPVTLNELTSLVDMSENIQHNHKWLAEIIGLCGSFLTIREDVVYFVHQSAKDYLTTNASAKIFPSGRGHTHYEIFSKSLYVMSETLRQDIYKLHAPGHPIEQAKAPDPDLDPLAALRYSCVYWVDHLYDWNLNYQADQDFELQDGGIIDVFMRQKFLYWLEALSLCKSMSKGVLGMAELEALIQSKGSLNLRNFIHDAKRFVLYNRPVIEITPLQTYYSALIFTPKDSVVRKQFENCIPKWICQKPRVQAKWSPCLQTLEGHTSAVWSAVYSPNGRQLASCSSDNTVQLWDAATGASQHTLEGHTDGVGSVVYSPDSQQLASCSSDNTVRLWDAATGAPQRTLKGHTRWVSSVVYSPDSQQLASCSGDNTVRLWDAATGASQRTLKSHTSAVWSVVYSPDSQKLASCSSDNTVRLWDAATGASQHTLKGHTSVVWSAVFSPDGRQLASCSSDNTVRLWDVATGASQRTLKGHTNWVSSAVFSSDSRQLASCSRDNTVRLWDVATGASQRTPKGHTDWVSSVIYSPDGQQLASCSRDNTVRLWDVATGASQRTLKGHTGWVRSTVYSPHGRQLASCSSDNTVRLWDVATGASQRTLKGHTSAVSFAVYSPDGQKLASCSSDNTVRLWDAAATGAPQRTLKGHTGPISSVVYSPDGRQLASCSSDNTVRLWDAATGASQYVLEDHTNRVAFSPDGLTIITDSGSISLTSQVDYSPKRRGCGIDNERKWVTWNGTRVLWLPPEYRPVVSAVKEGGVAIGCSSGVVYTLNFCIKSLGKN